MDVAEYIRRKQKNENARAKEQPKATTTASKQKNETKGSEPDDNTKAMLNKYSKMNEEQLMQELFKVASVSSGKVSPETLDGFYKNISAKLTPEQAARMRDLISQLKRS